MYVDLRLAPTGFRPWLEISPFQGAKVIKPAKILIKLDDNEA
jgi:hypothetical protein